MDRREWLKRSAVAGAGLAASGMTPGPLFGGGLDGVGLGAGQVPRARNVIFFVYDGLTWEDIGTARYFAMRHRDRVLELERLLRGGASGSMLSHSLTSVVTDSAAAATAWSTGRKIVNREIAQYPDGTPLTTVLELARDRGLGTGLVTSARITHATPASWIAHLENRADEDEIARQYLTAGVDVMLGGGSAHFDPARRSDGRDLWQEFRDQGYEVLRTQDDLRTSTGSRLLGAFTPGHLAFEIDRLNQAVDCPSLADVTRKGLEVLEGMDRGFVLQIEAGRVDHANHHTDAASTLQDILAADEALAVALDFADRVPGTLLIMASDHGTGSGAVYGTGSWYLNSSQSLDRIALPTASFEYFLRQMDGSADPDMAREAATELFGVALDPERSELLARVANREVRTGHERAFRQQPYNGIHRVLTDSPPSDPGLNIHFSSGQHVAGPVPVALHGAGIEGRGLGIVDNTELHTLMLRALGIEHENPLMSEQEALEITASLGPDGADRTGDAETAAARAVRGERRPHWI